jgi:hypothetical protein
MATDKPTERISRRWQGLSAIAVSWIAVVATIVSYVREVYFLPSVDEYRFIRVVLALALAGAAFVLPGLLNTWSSSCKYLLTVTVACVLFAGGYFANPAQWLTRSPDKRNITFTLCRGENGARCEGAQEQVGCDDPQRRVAQLCLTVTKSTVLECTP